MDWPNPQDYNETIQYPAICFSDPDLKDAQIELSAIGLPRPVTGAFASVYKVSGSGGTLAVRCFHNEIPDLKLRYSKILEAFSGTSATWALKTQFVEQGIRVQGQWYPIVKMEWIDGLPLDRYLAKHGTNQSRLNKLAQDFKTLVGDLRKLGIAHGDLQHGNILVAHDEVKLIDYDGFFVPALAGLKSAELGHANYQHPYRSREHFGDYIDNFPAWLISISLMMLAADPELLQHGKDRECLLFAHADLVAPYESALFTKLREHPREEIREAARTLIRLLSCPVEAIPSLDASDEDLLNLPEMDPGEQMRLIDEISQTDSLRFIERPAALSALEKLSTTKRGPKEKLGLFFKQASTKGGEMLSNVLRQRLNSHDLATRGDAGFAAGNYQAAIESYAKAHTELAQDKKEHEKRNRYTDKSTRADRPPPFDYDRFEDHLNLRLGICHLLNNNAASSGFHYKSIVLKYKGKNNSSVQSIDAVVGLMMAYCQLGRDRDARDLIKEYCGWNDTIETFETPKFSAQNLSCTLLGFSNGPLAGVLGLKLALKLVASYFENAGQYEYAASLYESARMQRDQGSANDLDLVLHIGHCHLLNRRPDLAIGFFNNIMQVSETGQNSIHDRAAVGLAVAFKMMNSRQDIVKAMRSRLPEKLYECFKNEVDGPLGDLEELGEVICAFAAELGEADLMGGLRMATRLAADNFKRLDDKKLIDTVVGLLNEGSFSEAHELATEDILKNVELRKKFADSAKVFARNLTTCGAYKEAFEVIDKYSCPDAIVIDAMEGQLIRYFKLATRQLNWEASEFDTAMHILEALVARTEPSDFLCQTISDLVTGSSDRSDQFLYDVRRLADLLASSQADGASNSHVLKIRMFALTAESPNSPAPYTPLQDGVSKLGSQFSKATKAASVPAVELVRRQKMEADALQLLRQISQNQWEPDNYAKLQSNLEDMKKHRYLSGEFCDKIATTLLGYFGETTGVNRWQKEYVAATESQKEKVKVMLDQLMDTFSTVHAISPNTLRKLQRCIERV